MSTRILKNIALEVTKSTTVVMKPSKEDKYENSKDFEIGEKVFAFDGIWMYPATILSQELVMDRNKRGYRVHWEGWSNTDDSDLTVDFILKITNEINEFYCQVESLDDRYPTSRSNGRQEGKVKFIQNEKVLVYWSGQIYSAKILDIDDKKENDMQYKIRYLGSWGKSSNDWVSHKNVFKASEGIEEVKAHLKKCKQLIESEKKTRRKSDAKGFNSMNREKRSLEQCIGDDKNNVDAIDEWLTKNLFTEEPKTNAKQNSKMSSEKQIAEDRDDSFDKIAAALRRIEVAEEFKEVASKRTLLKEIEALKKENRELKSLQTRNFCLKCKRYYDYIAKEKGIKPSSEQFIYKKKKSKRTTQK